VRHVIVTGHYGCGGVRAVFDGMTPGILHEWLRHVDDVRRRHERALNALSPEAVVDRLCELNVIEQARHVCETVALQDAWARGQQVAVHGWIYGLHDGRLRDLGFVASRPADVAPAYARAIGA